MNKYNNGKFHEINTILDKYDGKRPGVAAIAIKDGEIIYKRETGLANLEYGISIKSNTVFNLASISKPIAATAIVMLKEKGDLEYDEDITTYFPELGHYCKGVTIKNLLNHTSGIVNYYEILREINKSALHFTNGDCYELLKKQQKLLFNPGTEFDYSNSNYVLLAMIIEKITGDSFSEFIKENIFAPSEMNSTLVFDEGQPIVPNRAYGYDVEEDGFYCNYIDSLTIGDGCIFSSIDDMTVWINNLYEGKLISMDSLEECFTSAKGIDGKNLGYGLGWETGRSTETLRRVHHSGLDAAFNNLMTTFPDHSLTVILLSNSSDFIYKDRLAITEEFISIYI